ncbi:MAG: isoprenylcysteine carboxylmethyltransferase family protein [Actinomycetota bacterium]|nr:isoprenylcysteine carboxylmethyltransferase family protein [Actinomycetota bacterium]
MTATSATRHLVPAIFTTPWLWPIAIVVLLAAGATDLQVHWQQRRPRPGPGDVVLAVTLVVVGLASVATGATLPAADTVLWPSLGLTVMAASLVLRVAAMRHLGADFNGDLMTRPGQVVVDAGPYRLVRHPGYLSVGAYLTGNMLLFGFWPPIVAMVILMGAFLRARILKEEGINRDGIVGYDDYTQRVRWRLIPGLW